MSIVTPVQSFSVGDRSVLTCRIPNGNPHVLLEKKAVFWTQNGTRKSVSIDGISTAGELENHHYDLLYSGDLIEPGDLSEDSVLEFSLASARTDPE